MQQGEQQEVWLPHHCVVVKRAHTTVLVCAASYAEQQARGVAPPCSFVLRQCLLSKSWRVWFAAFEPAALLVDLSSAGQMLCAVFACRHSLSSAHWLLTANPFSIGDTITYSSSSWLVIDFNAAATTLQCLATSIPHTVPNPSLRGSTSIANSSRCSAPTIAVRASIVGMPAAKLEQFLEHVQAAAAAAAAAQTALFVAGSCGVRLVGDRLVCNGSIDFVEAELALEWVSGCAGEAPSSPKHCC